MSANAIETLREAIQTYVDDVVPSEDFQPTVEQWWDALAAVETLLEAAKRVDDLSAALPLEVDRVWAACEALHEVIRRVETGQ